MHPLESSSMLLSYMRQIALGMHCFASKSYVHRDLAARNILMSGDGTTCKVCIAIKGLIKNIFTKYPFDHIAIVNLQAYSCDKDCRFWLIP